MTPMTAMTRITPNATAFLFPFGFECLMILGWVARAEDWACHFQRGPEPCPSCWHVRIWWIKPHCCYDRITEHGHCLLHGTWWTSSDVIRRSCLSDSRNVITNGTRNVVIRNVHHIRKWDGRDMRHASTWLEKCIQFWSENPKQRDNFSGIAQMRRAWVWCWARRLAVMITLVGLRFSWSTVLYTDQDMILVRNVIDAQAEDFVVNHALLCPFWVRSPLDSLTTRYWKCLMFSVCVQ
jgi:hypothetical protein